MGKCELSTILKTDERSIHLELGRERRLTAKSSCWDGNAGFCDVDFAKEGLKSRVPQG
jgi:hypothetical protein